MKRSAVLIVTILSIPALSALAVAAVRKGADGATLIVIEVAVAAWLTVTAFATAAAAAREPQLSRYGTLVLLVACAFSAAIGRHPALFANVGEALAVIFLIAAAAIAAAWQVGVEPLLAFVLVRW